MTKFPEHYNTCRKVYRQCITRTWTKLLVVTTTRERWSEWRYHGVPALEMLELMRRNYDDPQERPSNPTTLLAACKGPLRYNEASGIVSIPEVAALEIVHKRPEDIHFRDESYIAQQCLLYLSISCHAGDFKTLNERLERFKGCRYVAEFWRLHTKRAEDPGEDFRPPFPLQDELIQY